MDTEKDTVKQKKQISWESLMEFLDTMGQRLEESRKQQEEFHRRREEDYKRWREEQDRQSRERAERYDRWEKEQDRRFKEWEEEQKKFDKRLKGLNDLYTNNWGRLMESLSQPAVLSLFKEMGIGITHIYEGPREDVSDPDNAIEVDTILCNTTVAVVTEVKTTCRPDDIDHFLKQMERFKTIFHEFANKTVYVAIAAIRYDGFSDRYAQKKGLFVIKTTGEGVFSIDEPSRRREF